MLSYYQDNLCETEDSNHYDAMVAKIAAEEFPEDDKYPDTFQSPASYALSPFESSSATSSNSSAPSVASPSFNYGSDTDSESDSGSDSDSDVEPIRLDTQEVNPQSLRVESL